MIFRNGGSANRTKAGDNRLGPNLHNIIGRKAGSLPNYGYSSAMKGADFVWDKEKLDRFIAKPDEIVPDNNMKPIWRLPSADDRAKRIARYPLSGIPIAPTPKAMSVPQLTRRWRLS